MAKMIMKAEAKNRSTGTKSELSKLAKSQVLEIYDKMLKARVLEERQIKIYKVGDSYFWLGGPGEEAFGVPLGLLTKHGQGWDYDWSHFHYRCSSSLVAMGLGFVDPLRLMMNKATDPYTGGRNFSNHFSIPEWQVAPVTSTLEVQYQVAIGTAIAQRRRKAKGITIVTGGDAGTAEGDFASALVWSSRKGNELPMFITVQNNGYGISTPYEQQHGEEHIADRGKAFGIRTAVIDGNNPIESYIRLKEEMTYIRKECKPVLLEAMVSRLHGHSSATGALRVNERDCLEEFEQNLLKEDYLTEKKAQKMRKDYEDESIAAQELVKQELGPEAQTIWDHYYVNNENGDWRKF